MGTRSLFCKKCWRSVPVTPLPGPCPHCREYGGWSDVLIIAPYPDPVKPYELDSSDARFLRSIGIDPFRKDESER